MMSTSVLPQGEVLEGTADLNGSGNTSKTAQPRRPMHFSEAEQQNFVRRANPVFSGVVYWINPAFGASECQRISQLLEHGGGKPATARRHKAEDTAAGGEVTEHCGKLNGVLVRGLPQMVNHIARFYFPTASVEGGSGAHKDAATHVISPDTHFGEYAACVKAGVCVVTSRWVDRCAMAGWQYVERYYSPDARKIFSGMVVAATHLPAADKETLLASVMALGGQWRERMRPDVTHLVVMKEEGPKYEYARKHPELGIRPILPHWFLDTLNMLHPFPQEPYLFPNPPRLLGKLSNADEKPLSTENGVNNVGSGSLLAVPTADSHTGSAYELPKPESQFLHGYTVAICTQLRYSLSEGAISRLTQRLTEAGATVAEPRKIPAQPENAEHEELPESLVTEWDPIDILLCQHRTGYDYSKASRLGKIVGTFVWLYQIYLSGKMKAPTQCLLHYPLPVVPVPGMDRMVVSISHYTGAAREYIRRLVLAMGAECTPKLTRANTHLITARSDGRKYSAAIEWNIDVVNHFWIEMCYQRWKLLSVSHPIFTNFPDLPILNSIVGNTEVTVNRLKSWVDSPQGDSIAESSDMDILADSDLDDKDADLRMQVDRGTSAGHDDGSESADEAKSVAESADGEDSNKKELALGQIRHTSRAAAMAASRTLGEMMKAANIFETEMRKERLYKYRKAGSGRRTLMLAEGEGDANDQKNGDPQTNSPKDVQVDEVSNFKGKRSGQAAATADSALHSHSSGAKRQRTDSTGARVRIMFTQVRPSQSEEEQIIQMGGEIVEDATSATHLVAMNIRRTYKMLMALASGSVSIVGRKWMEDSLSQRKWIPVDYSRGSRESSKYWLMDREGEERWGFSLETAIQRAWMGRLLDGVTVLVTPNSEPSLKTLKPLIEIAGGEVVGDLPSSRLRLLVRASCRAIANKKITDDDLKLPLLVVSCKEDSDQWPKFQQHASAGIRFPVYGTEIILTGLLRQRLMNSSTEFDMSSV
ncbi:regulator of Ty1 Transposition [Coemansia sp. RSA 1933]|nr:regulator of Ty1 Transposition [Coemansia sp. RSA 1933]